MLKQNQASLRVLIHRLNRKTKLAKACLCEHGNYQVLSLVHMLAFPHVEGNRYVFKALYLSARINISVARGQL